MTRLKLGGLAAVAMTVGMLSVASPAMAEDCGNKGAVKNIEALGGISCADAKRVGKTWRKLCNFGGKCQVEADDANVGQRFICKGNDRGGRLYITCKGEEDPGEKVKFDVKE